MVQQLQEHRADVVVLQEVFYSRARKILTKGLQKDYPYQTVVLNTKTISLKSNGGVLILSKHPFVAPTQSIRFKARKGIDRMARKGAILVEVAYKGRHLQVIGTHLQAWSTDSILYQQYQQIYNELLLPNSKPNIAQFICGDFNTLKQLPDSLPSRITPAMVARLPRYQKLLATLQAEDGELVGKQQYTMDRPHNDLCKSFKQYRLVLDYILLRKQGQPLTLQRQVRIFRQQWHKKHQDLSDHYAVEAMIGWGK